jgi:hypothetical protein
MPDFSGDSASTTGVPEQPLEQLRDFPRCHSGHELTAHLVLVHDAGAGFALEEVRHVLARVRRALCFIALLQRPRKERRHPPLRPFQLRRADAVLPQAVRFDDQRGHALLEPSISDTSAQGKRSHAGAEPAVTHAEPEHLRVGAPHEVLETLVHDPLGQPMQQRAPIVPHPRLRLRRPLPHDVDRRTGCLRVGHNAHKRLIVQRNRVVSRRRRRGAPGTERSEGRPQRRLERHGIGIADQHERHPVRAIEGVVKSAKPLRRRGAQHVGLPDRQPLGVAGLEIEDGHLSIPDPGRGTQSTPPLLDHDPAFLFYLAGIDRQAAGDVCERGETTHHDLGLVGRQVEHVDRLFERSVGVDVWPEPRPDRFEVRNELARFEVLAAVEGHVLEEVREPLLIVGLVERAGLHREAQQHTSGGPAVLPDVEGEPIRERAGLDGRVERDLCLKIQCRPLLARVGESQGEAEGREQANQDPCADPRRGSWRNGRRIGRPERRGDVHWR